LYKANVTHLFHSDNRFTLTRFRNQRKLKFKMPLLKFIRFYNEERSHFSNKYRAPAQAEADLETINRQIPTTAQSQNL